MMRFGRIMLPFLVALGVTSPAAAESLRLAVAANFAQAAERLAEVWEQESGNDKPQVIVGASGQLAAQLIKGAPFDLYFSADVARVDRMVSYGKIAPEDTRIYARGRLVFWQPTAAVNLPLALRIDSLTRIARANERLAPYGRAAVEVMQNFDRTEGPEMVLGQSVGQVYGMIETGAVEAGFVARSQFGRKCEVPKCIVIDNRMHSPISQAVGLMEPSRNKAQARAFFDFLDTASARRVIEGFGYLPGAHD